MPFLYLVLPNLFFSGAVFFVSGALSRKLLVVYTQGILLFFLAYYFAEVMARGVENQVFAAILDSFCIETVNVVTQFWTVAEKNSMLVPMEGALLYNRLAWVAVGILSLVIGYYGFSLNTVRDSIFKRSLKAAQDEENRAARDKTKIEIPAFTQHWGIKANVQQLKHQSLFYFKSIFKEVPFWAIVVCGMALVVADSINIGNTFGTNTYPTTYLVLEALQGNAAFLFLIILVFYSGELTWTERGAKMDLIHGASPVTDFVNLASKFMALVLTFIVLIFALILSGMFIQTFKGYYHYELGLYFNGFFAQFFPFVILYTLVSFFFQALANHKFLGDAMVVVFFLLANMALNAVGIEHGLFRFGGGGLGAYSDMNGFGHFPLGYSWFKVYWFAFTVILFVIAILFSVRGPETLMKFRWKMAKQRMTRPLMTLGATALVTFALSGCYIYYNTNVLNKYGNSDQRKEQQAGYEKTLKKYKYLPQPKITGVNLKVDLYPCDRDWVAEGYYVLTNKHSGAIDKIHVQKLPNYQLTMDYLRFEGGATADNGHGQFGHYIYELDQPLQPGDSIKMEFKQVFTTKGFVERGSNTQIVYNGTFLFSGLFPTLGYNSDFELPNDNDRKGYGLVSCPEIGLHNSKLKNGQKEEATNPNRRFNLMGRA